MWFGPAGPERAVENRSIIKRVLPHSVGAQLSNKRAVETRVCQNVVRPIRPRTDRGKDTGPQAGLSHCGGAQLSNKGFRDTGLPTCRLTHVPPSGPTKRYRSANRFASLRGGPAREKEPPKHGFAKMLFYPVGSGRPSVGASAAAASKHIGGPRGLPG